MSPRSIRFALGFIAAAFALVSLVGLVLSPDTPLHLQVSVVLSGSLMLVAGWFLLRANQVAVFLLAAAALVYFLSIVVPAYSRHGTELFTQLIPAFYWSLTIRVSLIAFSYYALRRQTFSG